jgi:phosphohistidine phosphatase
MTKTLLLMRHAKSSWKDETLSDHERPLNKRGRHDAPRMGQLLQAEQLTPDLVVSSTAQRARNTVELVGEAAGYHGDIRYTDNLYHAGATDIVEVVCQLDDDCHRALLVGHNPGMIDLLEYLTGTSQPFPTAAVAHLELAVANWRDTELTTRATLLGLWRPRDLP